MNELEFWQVIERSLEVADGDAEAQLEALENELESLEPDQILGFQKMFDHLFRVSYRAEIWGVAFIVNGGASDDGFDYFRGWLIAQGREVFEGTLAKPDSLADVIDDPDSEWGFEDQDILNVGYRTWLDVTGLESDDFYALAGKSEPMPEIGEFLWGDGAGDINPVKGKKIYPKLWKKFEMGG
jgi:Protein of unknown function (DUF4240)